MNIAKMNRIKALESAKVHKNSDGLVWDNVTLFEVFTVDGETSKIKYNDVIYNNEDELLQRFPNAIDNILMWE